MFLRLRRALAKRRSIRLTRRLNRIMCWLDDDRTNNWRLGYLLEKWEEEDNPVLFLRIRIHLMYGTVRRHARRYKRVLKRTERISKRIARSTNKITEFGERIDARELATTFRAWLKADSIWISSRRWVRK